jgi:hypothetical protein
MNHGECRIEPIAYGLVVQEAEDDVVREIAGGDGEDGREELEAIGEAFAETLLDLTFFDEGD